jgi:hypothetical protein
MIPHRIGIVNSYFFAYAIFFCLLRFLYRGAVAFLYQTGYNGLPRDLKTHQNGANSQAKAKQKPSDGKIKKPGESKKSKRKQK